MAPCLEVMVGYTGRTESGGASTLGPSGPQEPEERTGRIRQGLHHRSEATRTWGRLRPYSSALSTCKPGRSCSMRRATEPALKTGLGSTGSSAFPVTECPCCGSDPGQGSSFQSLQVLLPTHPLPWRSRGLPDSHTHMHTQTHTRAHTPLTCTHTHSHTDSCTPALYTIHPGGGLTRILEPHPSNGASLGLGEPSPPPPPPPPPPPAAVAAPPRPPGRRGPPG